ncbi:MAG: TraB/GumN family protein [Aureispira sp.]
MSTSSNSLLWELQLPQHSAPSYLFGTMHVRDERVFSSIDKLTTYLHQCDAFAAEFDFQEANFSQLEQASQLPEGVGLHTALSPSIYKKLAKVVAKETHQPLEVFDQRSPMLLLNLLAEAQLSTEQNVALDKLLYDLALQAGKKILGLETFQEQLDVFQHFNLAEQYRALKQVATNFKRYKRTLQKTTAAYFKGDMNGLYQQSKRSIGSMRRVLLYERNQKMADRFEAYTQEQTLFAAIGAGHLAGQKGVLRLLKKKGYRLRPLPYHL